MSHQEYVVGEEAPILDPYSTGFNIEPITKYFLQCSNKCDFQIKGFCTCLTGHCFPEENGEIFDQDSRIILQV